MDNTTYVKDDMMVINGKEYALVTHGRQQAIQVQGITRWASKYGAEVYNELQKQGNSDEDGGIQFLMNMIGFLTADALIDLFRAVSGCTAEEAELYFDAASLIEAGIVVYDKHPTVRALLDRFFSTSDSEQGEPEESSTISE